MKTIDFEKAIKSTPGNQKAQEFFAVLAPKLDPKSMPKIDVHRARPFVSEMAWALFAAYGATVGYAAAQLNMLRMGLDAADILDPTAVSKLIVTALPYYSKYIEEHGAKGYPYIVEPLEAALLRELQRMMRGEESDRSSVEQAAKIMHEVSIVNEAMSKSSTGGNG